MRGYYRRDLRWHFVWMHETDETALYDLVNDPGQLADVSAEYPGEVDAFKTDIQALRDRYE